MATGSPFDPVHIGGRTIVIGQGNNAFVFPGMGLGAMVAEATEITDGMFAAAAESLAGEVHAEDLASGSLFPPVRDLRRVTAHVAEAVVRRARDEGVGRPVPDAQVPEAVSQAMWNPAYLPLVPVAAPTQRGSRQAFRLLPSGTEGSNDY